MKQKVLRPVHPNVGIQAEYRRKLDALIAEMTRSYVHFLKARYRANPPAMAMDATPAREMQRELKDLGARWEKRWNSAAPKLARWFAQSTERRSRAMLDKILKDAGIAVEFKMTRAMKDAFDATVFEQVNLIKSIPEKYHTDVQGIVMRSVTVGRDLESMAKELQQRYGLTKKRAAFISLDQNNKSTAVFTRVRQQEAGITEAIWLHSHAGKYPRKTHVANSGKKFKISEGWYDPDPKVSRQIWPGELPRCRCVSKSIVKGFS
jgi:uncharacterized protein with gpF-like domain